MNTTNCSHDGAATDLAEALSALTTGGITFTEVDVCPAERCSICTGTGWEPLPQAA